MNRIALAAMLVFLGACETTPVVPTRVVAPAVAVTCPSACTQSCLPAEIAPGEYAWPQWGGDANDPRAWDRIYPDIADPTKEIARRCDRSRAACVQCLARVEATGLICGVTVDCFGGESE